MLTGPSEHRSDGREDLAELVVQLAGQFAESRLASRNKPLRQLTPLVGKRRELCKKSPVRLNQVRTGRNNRGERGGEKPIHASLHPAVNLLNLLCGLFLAFVVL